MAQGSFSITDIAKLLLNTLKNREISSTIVIGHSLGGYVAAAIARIDPGFLYGLGFFHSTACADSPERSILRDSTVQFLKRRGSEAFAKSFVPQQFAKEGWKKNIASIEKSIAMVSSCADSSLIAYTKAMKNRRDELLTIGKLNIPLLMISGEKDALVTADQNREEMKFYKRPHIYFLENSAHMGMFEDTAKCNTIIDEFVGCCNPTGK